MARRLLKECNSDSTIRVCCAETQTIDGQKVSEMGSSLLCGQSGDVAEQLHTALNVITCGASSVLAGTCGNTLCVLPLHLFVVSQIRQMNEMMASMLLPVMCPVMCAQPVESVVPLVVTHNKTRTALHLQMDSWCHPHADTISESVVVSNVKVS